MGEGAVPVVAVDAGNPLVVDVLSRQEDIQIPVVVVILPRHAGTSYPHKGNAGVPEAGEKRIGSRGSPAGKRVYPAEGKGIGSCVQCAAPGDP